MSASKLLNILAGDTSDLQGPHVGPIFISI
jgi:hypothetical protein